MTMPPFARRALRVLTFALIVCGLAIGLLVRWVDVQARKKAEQLERERVTATVEMVLGSKGEKGLQMVIRDGDCLCRMNGQEWPCREDGACVAVDGRQPAQRQALELPPRLCRHVDGKVIGDGCSIVKDERGTWYVSGQQGQQPPRASVHGDPTLPREVQEYRRETAQPSEVTRNGPATITIVDGGAPGIASYGGSPDCAGQAGHNFGPCPGWQRVSEAFQSTDGGGNGPGGGDGSDGNAGAAAGGAAGGGTGGAAGGCR